MAEKADKRTRSKPNKLALKLVTIMGEMEKLQKKGRNSQQGYTFISHEQIVNELKPLLVKHKVMIIPSVIDHALQQYGTTKSGAPMTQSKVTVQYTIIDAENPSDTIVSTWAGEGTDSSDKATNKSVTASGKYYLMKLFNIAEEDPDEKGSPDDHVATSYGGNSAPQYSATNSQEVDNKPITAPQIKYLSQILIRKKVATPELRKAIVAATMGYDPSDDTFEVKSLTSKEASTLIEDFNNTSTEALLARAKVTNSEELPPPDDLPEVPFA